MCSLNFIRQKQLVGLRYAPTQPKCVQVSFRNLSRCKNCKFRIGDLKNIDGGNKIDSKYTKIILKAKQKYDIPKSKNVTV